ncbi:HET-domain-containing protein, partial [Hyaloscypha hepaticicola]
MASQRHYQYRPLEKGRCIRLLRLEPGDAAAAQKISIFHADLDQQATYEALSYTWGDPDDTTLISCTEEGSTLAVTRNCEAALRSLRLEYEERTLWIDAICIDQSNVDERGQQVRLMSDIYKQAQQVIAYLGEASHDSQVGMDFILHDLQAISAAGEDRPSMAIDHILTRPYFERIWIIQEIVFARQVNIVLGDRTVDWEAFKRTAYYVDINKQVLLGGDRKPPRVLKYKDRATSFTSGKVSTSKPDALLELLRDMRMCKATDPRDKIHALL